MKNNNIQLQLSHKGNYKNFDHDNFVQLKYQSKPLITWRVTLSCSFCLNAMLFLMSETIIFRQRRQFDVQCHREQHIQCEISVASTHPLARSLSRPVVVFTGNNRCHCSGRQTEERNSKLFWIVLWMVGSIQNWWWFSRCILQQILCQQYREYVNVYTNVCSIQEQSTKTLHKFRSCKLRKLHSRNVGLAKEKSTVEIHVETFEVPNDGHVCFGWGCVYYRSFWWDSHCSWNLEICSSKVWHCFCLCVFLNQSIWRSSNHYLVCDWNLVKFSVLFVNLETRFLQISVLNHQTCVSMTYSYSTFEYCLLGEI